MTINTIDHLYIATLDFDNALDFWLRLGFTVTDSWDDEGHRGAHLESGVARIVLAEDEPTGVTVHLGTVDIDGFSNLIDGQQNVAVDRPVEATHWGTRWMRVRDPDGSVFSIEEISSDPS